MPGEGVIFVSDRVEMKRGTATIRVIAEQVEYWESKGYSKPQPARRGRKPKAEQEEGDQ